MPAAATAIPVKPRTAASRATTKKMRAQRSMMVLLVETTAKSLAGVRARGHTAEGVFRAADLLQAGRQKPPSGRYRASCIKYIVERYIWESPRKATAQGKCKNFRI